jgi:GNAT superfamily N-acetyltransferase
VLSDHALQIRAARQQDAARIRALVRAERLNPFGLDWRRFYVMDNAAGQVAGAIQQKAHWRLHRPPVRELASLVVDPAWRGQGLGSRLVRHLQNQAGPPLWLMCRSGLVPFYEQLDFREVVRKGEMPVYFAIMQAAFDLLTPGRRTIGFLAIMFWQG